MLRKKSSGKFDVADFQKYDIDLLSKKNCSSNWSEMGCRKTSTAEWLWQCKLNNLPNPRVLVVTTKTGKGTYFESLGEVLPNWDVFSITTTKNNLVVDGVPVPVNLELPNPLYMRPVVCVAHFHCFTNRSCLPKEKRDNKGEFILDPETGLFEVTVPKCAELMVYPWDYIVIDEAHRIKNPDAQWTRNLKKLKPTFKHIMTGRGFVNNPSEIWSLLNFLHPERFTSFLNFRREFCEIDNYNGYEQVLGVKPEREEDFRDLVREFGVRRTMLECFPDIKKPIETVIPVDLNPTQKKMYTEMLDTLSTMDALGEPLFSPNVLSMLNRLRQICVATPKVIEDYFDAKQDRRIIKVKLTEPSSKLDAVMEVIEGLEWDKERRDQIAIFSNFKDPLLLLERRFQKAGIPYLRLLTEMNDDERYKLWHDVWPKKEHQVFLSTLALGSESINLTSAHRAIFLDQAWSPAVNSQAIGRVYRPGQTGAVQIIYIRATDTVDYKILDAVNEKDRWFEQIFGVRDVEGEKED